MAVIIGLLTNMNDFRKTRIISIDTASPVHTFTLVEDYYWDGGGLRWHDNDAWLENIPYRYAQCECNNELGPESI